MSKVQLAGNANGTGIFTIASPNSNTDRTLTLPDNTGTLLTSGSTILSSQLPVGTVLQVGYVSSSTQFDTSSTSFQSTDISLSFTPVRSNSKILLQCDLATNFTQENGGLKSRFYDVTGAAQLGNVYNCHRLDIASITSAVYAYNRAAMFWRLDSWGTTAKTIRVEYALIEGVGTASVNVAYPTTQSTQFIIWEIAA